MTSEPRTRTLRVEGLSNARDLGGLLAALPGDQEEALRSWRGILAAH